MTLPVLEAFTFSGTGSVVSSRTMTLPSGIVAGEWLWVYVAVNVASDTDLLSTSSTGWTKYSEYGGVLGGLRAALFRKEATGGDASPVIDTSSAGEMGGWAMRISGTTGAVNTQSKNLNYPSTSFPTLTGITTTFDDCLCLYFYTHDYGGLTGGQIGGNNFTLQDAQPCGTAGGDISMVFGTRNQATAGATGNQGLSMGVSAVGVEWVWSLKPIPAVSVTVNVTGVSATGSVGTVTARGKARAYVTTNLATSHVGSVTATGKANVSVTGLSTTSGIGDAVASGAANVAVTGLNAEGRADNPVTVTGQAIVPATGIEAFGEVGTLTIITTGSVTVYPTGNQASGAVGSVSLGIGTTAYPTGTEATSEIGDISTSLPMIIEVGGPTEAIGYVGDVLAYSEGAVIIFAEGFVINGFVGAVYVPEWYDMKINQDANYEDITSSTTNWTSGSLYT
jgi:hypothetical protein